MRAGLRGFLKPHIAGVGGELDAFTANLYSAYATRQLVSSATQCLRVRNSGTSVESDIGFANGTLDEAGLLTAVGANSGFIRTLYDQSGNGRTFIQTTAANQPRVANSGVYDGKFVFDGTNDGMVSSANVAFTDAQGGMAIFFRLTRRSTGASHVILEMSTNSNTPTNGNLFMYYLADTAGATMNVRLRNNFSSVKTRESYYADTPAITDVYCMRILAGAAGSVLQCRMFKNGVEVSRTGNSDSGVDISAGPFNAAHAMYLGNRGNASLFAPIDIDTFVIYDDELTTTQIADISAALA